MTIVIAVALFIGVFAGLDTLSDKSYVLTKRREYKRINEMLERLERAPRNMKAVEAFVVRDIYEALEGKYRNNMLSYAGGIVVFFSQFAIMFILDSNVQPYVICLIGIGIGVVMWAYNEMGELYTCKWKKVYDLHEKLRPLSHGATMKVYEYTSGGYERNKKMWVATISYRVQEKYGEGVFDVSPEDFMHKNEGRIWAIVEEYYIDKRVPDTYFMW